MGATPNKSRGTSASAFPYSFSTSAEEAKVK
jgi:hypothetical protein